ncbi:carbohydrate ABC transporter permease [Caldicoprobacter algeriensis]|uniref:carbohydrate ABC transporter permease n=1 Tax=Caldicoprobacter algeriensis TaxID=699281 RepID=UPI00207AFF18|nr:sugar ABC transporter permease [Caldicoprobacter algeriensis]
MIIQNKELKKNITGYLFIAPNLIGFMVLTFIPVLFSLVVSFTEWNLFTGTENIRFVGLKNYLYMFSDVWFIDSLKNNLMYTVVTISLALSISLFIAIILNDKVYGRNIIRAMFFMPYISNIVAISAIWLALYNPNYGPLNQFLMSIGIDNPPQWLASSKWALPAIMIMSIWGGLGYNVVVYLAGLKGIPKELYEAADIDGANSWHKLRHVTIPMLSPTIFFLLITGIISSFQVFGQINIMTQGGPARATTVIAYYIYLSGFRYYKMGYAAAMAWFLFIGIFIVTLIQWRGQKKWVNYI